MGCLRSRRSTSVGDRRILLNSPEKASLEDRDLSRRVVMQTWKKQLLEEADW